MATKVGSLNQTVDHLDTPVSGAGRCPTSCYVRRPRGVLLLMSSASKQRGEIDLFACRAMLRHQHLLADVARAPWQRSGPYTRSNAGVRLMWPRTLALSCRQR